MRRALSISVFLGLALLGVVLVVLLWFIYGELIKLNAPKYYEYRTTHQWESSILADISLWGSSGWEVVGMSRFTDRLEEPTVKVILKKEYRDLSVVGWPQIANK